MENTIDKSSMIFPTNIYQSVSPITLQNFSNDIIKHCRNFLVKNFNFSEERNHLAHKYSIIFVGSRNNNHRNFLLAIPL